MTKKSVLALHGLDNGPQLFPGGVNVDRKVVVEVRVELNRVAHLQKLLFIDQAGDSKPVLGHHCKIKNHD